MKLSAIIKDLNYADAYWYLWPPNVDDDDAKINIVRAKDNYSREERYHMPIRAVCKSEYILLAALVLGTVLHRGRCEKLWNIVTGKMKKRG